MSAALRRRLAPTLTAAVTAIAAGASCVEAPAPPPATPRIDLGPLRAPAPAPLPARWVESSGVTAIGPEVSGGTLVLLGGRRALARPDGTVEAEGAPAPEPLMEIAVVPTPRGPRVVGRGAHGVYRFDDALGPAVTLARSEADLGHLGVGPSVVAVWTERSDLPRFLDVETGHEQRLATLPEPPLRALVFVDERRGAGVFEAVGLAVTTDAGASWRVAAGHGPGDAIGVNGVRRHGAAVRAFAFQDGPDAAVDLDHARLEPLDAQAAIAREPAILRWIRKSGRDPLEAAAAGGIVAPLVAVSSGSRPLVASHGMIARVDARTGALTDLLELAHGKWLPCSAARSGASAWVACTLADGAGKNLFDPFGVLRVPLAEGPLQPDKPALLRNGEAELRASPSGGVMLMAACSNEEQGQACARQPDGTWRTITTGVDLAERGAGPLADGRIAFLRGLFDGDDPSDAEAGVDDDGAPLRRLHVALVGPAGKEQARSPIAFTPSRGYVRVESPIEEDAGGTLHFVIEDGEGPFVVSAPPGREAAPAQRITDATAARIHAGHGIAVGDGHVLASLDGGGTWSEIAAPPSVLDAASAVAAAYDEPDRLAVSDVGAKVGPMLRLGWGPPDPATTPGAAPLAGPLFAAAAVVAMGPERALVCSSVGPAAGAPPLLGAAQIRELLAGKAAKKTGLRRESSVWSPARAGMLDAVALFEEEGSDKRQELPVTWTFRWHDPEEIGGKVRSATLKAPAGAAWGTSLRFAAASGGRALFAARSGGKLWLIRIKPGGAAETVEVAQELVPAGEVVFGAGRGEAIAWGHETWVIAWLAGERPRPIAALATHASRALGTPTQEGVPLLLGAADWSLLRVLPIPAIDKAFAVAPLDGWTRLAPLRGALGTLPACAPRPRGSRFSLARPTLRAEIDGVDESAATALYELYVAGTEACVAGITATLAPARDGGQHAPVVAARPSAQGARQAAGAPAGFVRVDLAGKRAEGGDRGLAPEAAVRRMRCAFEEKR